MAPPRVETAPPPVPVPALAPASAPPPAAVPPARAKPEGKRSLRPLILALAAVVVLGGGVFAWQTFMTEPEPPPPVAVKPKAKAAPAAVPAVDAKTPAAAAKTPSDTLNSLAHAPANAIQKAQNAVNARAASGQSEIPSEVDSGLATKPAAPATAATTGSRTVAPGLTAMTALDAAPEASAAFRSFVANAKISGVVATRAIVNGRLLRVGETVDQELGISFEGYDTEKNQLLFKDRSGATVARRYP